jgi:hypothetical protein
MMKKKDADMKKQAALSSTAANQFEESRPLMKMNSVKNLQSLSKIDDDRIRKPLINSNQASDAFKIFDRDEEQKRDKKKMKAAKSDSFRSVIGVNKVSSQPRNRALFLYKKIKKQSTVKKRACSF